MTFAGRDAAEVEALRSDRYLEALLAAGDRRASDVPADLGLDPDVRVAATRLARELVPVHPSFRFEERVAGELAEHARSLQLAAAAGGESLPIAIPMSPEDDDPAALRPYLIGGAITSAALSLAGAAWVAWRRSHAPARSPMARAVRAARNARHGRHARTIRSPRVLS